MIKTLCPVCGYDLGFEAWDAFGPSDQICPSCGTQFGYHDSRKEDSERNERHDELRQKWIGAGMPWHSRAEQKPTDWNPELQLKHLLKGE